MSFSGSVKGGGVKKVDLILTFHEGLFGATSKPVAATVLLLEVSDHCWWLNIGGLLYMYLVWHQTLPFDN